MPSPQPPSPDGLQGLAWLWEWFSIPLTAAVSAAVAWTTLRVTSQDHENRIREHHVDIAALKAADAATRILIAGLPTRQDLRDLRDEMQDRDARLQTQIQNGFENMSRMIEKRS